jgi:hypothetical protein
VFPTASLPGSYSGGVLCHTETLHVTLQPDLHGYGLSVVSPDSSSPAVVISNIDPGGPADRYSQDTLLFIIYILTPLKTILFVECQLKNYVDGILNSPSYLKTQHIYMKCCSLVGLLK